MYSVFDGSSACGRMNKDFEINFVTRHQATVIAGRQLLEYNSYTYGLTLKAVLDLSDEEREGTAACR